MRNEIVNRLLVSAVFGFSHTTVCPPANGNWIVNNSASGVVLRRLFTIRWPEPMDLPNISPLNL